MRNTTWMGLAAIAIALGGCDDGGTTDTDSGTTPGVDAGSTDAGGGDTDAGGGDMDGGPGEDGGVPGSDGGPTPDGGGADDGGSTSGCPVGSIVIQDTCPAFAACGGALVGDWCYTDICLTKAELLEGRLFGSCTVDDIEVRSSMGTVDGSIAITATEITRTVTTDATGTFYLPPNCVLISCPTTEMAINSALGTNGMATCDPEGDGCLCDITFSNMIDSTDTYTAAGNTITFDGSGRTFDYCIDGGDLVFRETTEDGEPGTQTATPMSAP